MVILSGFPFGTSLMPVALFDFHCGFRTTTASLLAL